MNSPRFISMRIEDELAFNANNLEQGTNFVVEESKFDAFSNYISVEEEKVENTTIPNLK